MQGDHGTAATGRLELRLFGCFDLRVEGRSVEMGRREQKLVAFLALRGRRSRAYVAGMLWPDTSESRAMTSLRTAVLRSRRAVPGVLETGRTNLALAADLDVDVDRLLRCAADIERAAGCGDAADALPTLASADLLPGWYDDWVLFEKQRLQHLRIRALESLAKQQLGLGQVDLALLAAQEAVALEPLRESAHALLLRAHLRAGNRAAAVRAYEDYRQQLRHELGIGPSLELGRLLQPGVVPAQWSPRATRAVGPP